MKIRDDHRVNAATHHIPHMRALNLRADAHAACTHDAAIVVEREPLVRRIDRQLWISIGQANMRHALLLAKGELYPVHFRVQDLNAMFEKIAATPGVEVLQEPMTQPWECAPVPYCAVPVLP